MRITTVLLLFFFALPFCSPGNGDDAKPLPREKMQAVVLDLLRADELINNHLLTDTLLKRDSVATQLYAQVFSIHNVSRQKFYNSLKYYQSHPDKNRELFDSLISAGNRKRAPAVQ